MAFQVLMYEPENVQMLGKLLVNLPEVSVGGSTSTGVTSDPGTCLSVSLAAVDSVLACEVGALCSGGLLLGFHLYVKRRKLGI